MPLPGISIPRLPRLALLSLCPPFEVAERCTHGLLRPVSGQQRFPAQSDSFCHPSVATGRDTQRRQDSVAGA